jgi:hypothetical protein
MFYVLHQFVTYLLTLPRIYSSFIESNWKENIQTQSNYESCKIDVSMVPGTYYLQFG